MTASPSISRRPWLFSPALDLLIGCGAWSLPFLAGTYFLQQGNAPAVSFAFYLLAVFCNNPHYMATIHRAYHSAEDFRKYRFFTVYVTVLIALTVALIHAVPTLFPWVVTLYLTWSPWHYTGQNFGIAQMLARRAGAPTDPTARNLLYTSYLASYAIWFLTLHSTHDGDPNFFSLRLPSGPTIILQILGAAVFLVCAAGAFVRLGRDLPGRALLGPLVLTLTQSLWFVAPVVLTQSGAVQLPASYFSAGALAFMHCAQYLWITSYYARQDRVDTGKVRAGFSFPRYYFMLVVGGLALFVPGPWVASRLLGHDFVESFLIFMALVNLHHFILDGAVWKLRDGRLARLLLGRNAPVAESAGFETPAFRHHLGWLFSPARAARLLRWGLAAGVVAIGAVDQWQYFRTQRTADLATLGVAEFVNPSDTRIHFRRAQLAIESGDLTAARESLARVLSINPRNAPAQHLMGELIFRSGDLDAALAHYDRMAQLFRPDLSTEVNRGLLAAQAGRPDEAVARFTHALRIAPHRTALHALLAQTLAQTGDIRGATHQYELFCTLFEENPGDLGNLPEYLSAGLALGKIHRDQGNLTKAEERFQRTADVAATHRHFRQAAGALTQLAELQESTGRPELASRNRAAATQALSYTP